MNRKNEFEAMIEELNQPAPGLETTLDRAYKKKRKRTTKMIVRPLGGLAACFVVFVLLVNFCVPVAYACSRIPGLRELAEAVTFSRSLTDAVKNEYVQPMDLTQTQNDITAQIEYLIVDQKQVNVFFRLDSEKYTQLEAHPDVRLPCGIVNNSFGAENGELRSFTVDFVDEDVPDTMTVYLRVYEGGVREEAFPIEAPDDIYRDNPIEEPEFLAEFEFLLEFDPEFTETGKVIPVNQTVIMDGQSITVTDIEIYPSHLRVNIDESPDNTAWIDMLYFYIETDWGMKFETGSGIIATGSEHSKSMVSYRTDSPFFYEAKHLKLVITGAKFLRKDMETTYLNLVTGEHGPLPDGAVFDCATRRGADWVVTFRAPYYEDKPMYQLFGHKFFDADGNEYEIHQWSSTYGDPDDNGNITYFYDVFPLKNYPYNEVWLSPQYSHYWTAEDLIVITVQ